MAEVIRSLWGSFSTGRSEDELWSESVRKQDTDIYKRIIQDLGDYREAENKQAYKAKLAILKAEVEMAKSKDKLYADLQETRGRDLRTSMEVTQRNIDSYRDAIANLEKKAGAAARTDLKRAREVSQQEGAQAGWQTLFNTTGNPTAFEVTRDAELNAIAANAFDPVIGLKGIQKADLETGELVFTEEADQWGEGLQGDVEEFWEARVEAHRTLALKRSEIDRAEKSLAGVGDDESALKKIQNELVANMNDLYTTMGIADTETAQDDLSAYMEEDAYHKRLEKMADEIERRHFTGSRKADARMAKIMADPWFRAWADERGFTSIGRTDAEGNYHQGNDDARALMYYALESGRGEDQYRMFHRSGTGQSIAVTYTVDPDQAKKFETTDGTYLQEIDPETGEKSYITSERRREIDAMAKTGAMMSQVGSATFYKDRDGNVFAVKSTGLVPLTEAQQEGLIQVGVPWTGVFAVGQDGETMRYASIGDVRSSLEHDPSIQVVAVTDENRAAFEGGLPRIVETSTFDGGRVTVTGELMKKHPATRQLYGDGAIKFRTEDGEIITLTEENEFVVQPFGDPHLHLRSLPDRMRESARQNSASKEARTAAAAMAGLEDDLRGDLDASATQGYRDKEASAATGGSTFLMPMGVSYVDPSFDAAKKREEAEAEQAAADREVGKVTKAQERFDQAVADLNAAAQAFGDISEDDKAKMAQEQKAIEMLEDKLVAFNLAEEDASEGEMVQLEELIERMKNDSTQKRVEVLKNNLTTANAVLNKTRRELEVARGLKPGDELPTSEVYTGPGPGGEVETDFTVPENVRLRDYLQAAEATGRTLTPAHQAKLAELTAPPDGSRVAGAVGEIVGSRPRPLVDSSKDDVIEQMEEAATTSQAGGLLEPGDPDYEEQAAAAAAQAQMSQGQSPAAFDTTVEEEKIEETLGEPPEAPPESDVAESRRRLRDRFKENRKVGEGLFSRLGNVDLGGV